MHYICPTCNKEFESESKIVKHFLSCWKEQNPNHVSKEAPRSENIETRQINNDVADFFKRFNS